MNDSFDSRLASEVLSQTCWFSSRHQVLADKDLAAVLRAADEPRELALLSLLSATGLRMLEVPRLEVDGLVRRRDGSALIYVPPGALHMGRLVLVPGDVAAHLDAYLIVRDNVFGDCDSGDRVSGEKEPLFFGDEGCALTAIETGLIVLRAISRVGIDVQAFVHFDGRQLRIADVLCLTFASRFLRAGGDLEGLRRRLGHGDVGETRKLAAQLASSLTRPRGQQPRGGGALRA